MPPNPHFGEGPRPIQREELPIDDGSANDDIFGEPESKLIEELSIAELLQKRKAHELQLKLGYRDPEIDNDVIAKIDACMMKLKGIGEEEYKNYLKTLRESA